MLAAFGQAIGTVIGPPTAEQAAAEAVIRAKGTSSPLVITEGTAANHVKHILARLTLDSRVQIAAWAVERGLYHSSFV